MPRPVVVCDLAACTAQVGGLTVGVLARPGGALVVGDRVIRPLRFGERWRVLADLADLGERSGAGAAVLAAAGTRLVDPAEVVGTAPVDAVILQILALHLAGARPERAVPGCARQLAGLVAAGWSPREVLDADADLVDLLAESMADGDADEGDGWTSIVLTSDEPQPASALEVLALLERDLLARVAPDEHEIDGADDGRGRAETTTGAPPRGGRGTVRDAQIDRTTTDAAGIDTGVGSRRLIGTSPTSPTSPTSAALTPTGLFDSGPIDSGLAGVGTEPAGDSGRRPRDEIRTASPAPFAFAPLMDRPRPREQGTLGRPLRPATGDTAHRRPAGLHQPGGSVIAWGPLAQLDVATAPAPIRGELDRGAVWSAAEPAAGRVGPFAAPTPDVLPAGVPVDVFDLADQVAGLLDDESDLRGLRP